MTAPARSSTNTKRLPLGVMRRPVVGRTPEVSHPRSDRQKLPLSDLMMRLEKETASSLNTPRIAFSARSTLRPVDHAPRSGKEQVPADFYRGENNDQFVQINISQFNEYEVSHANGRLG